MSGGQSITPIRLAIAGMITAFGLGIATPALAIDCTKASHPVDKRICENAGLKAADAAMGQAYPALLKEAPDPEIRAMLVNSQRRWISARNNGLGRSSNGVAIPISEIRRAMVERTARLGDRSDKGFVAQAQAQRRFLAKYTGGAFAGFDTRCEFIPNDKDQSSYSYQCYGAMHVRNKDRLCSLSTEWATRSLYEYYTVSAVENDQAKPSAFCSDQSGDICGYSQKVGWTRDAGQDQHVPSLKPNFPKLDVEGVWPLEEADATWFDQCLVSPSYPSAQ
jgi:uncharacterized protein